MNRIGNKKPEDIGQPIEEFSNYDTGMDYVVYSDGYGGRVLDASHEDVGQVTYYRVTQQEVDELYAEASETFPED